MSTLTFFAFIVLQQRNHHLSFSLPSSSSASMALPLRIGERDASCSNTFTTNLWGGGNKEN